CAIKRNGVNGGFFREDYLTPGERDCIAVQLVEGLSLGEIGSVSDGTNPRYRGK
ncbi:MAG: hypothetical protein HQK85_11010, partial [Nitrospinae bacterium]|nr:hypothetical protein [Nitrospinota bacterium]